MKNIQIGHKVIGKKVKPFIIAEMSGNHNQSLDRAFEIVDAAIEAGVDALKLQTATPDGLTLDVDKPDFRVNDADSLWYGRTLYSLYKDAVTPWEWHKPIFDYCRKRELIVFSSPFELAAVDFLEKLEVPCYKIASFELLDLPLVRKVAATGKPMIMSTGMATVSEIEDAVVAARSEGNEQIILLKCTSTYPATPKDSNILTIPHLKQMFGCQVGLSDHTLGVGVPIASVAFGATVIEKHFTLDREDGGVDSAFSMEPNEMSSLVIESERAWQALGEVSYGTTEKEEKSITFRRSIYITEAVEQGGVLTPNNMRIIRPGFGVAPKYYEVLLGRKVNQKLEKGTSMSWDYIG